MRRKLIFCPYCGTRFVTKTDNGIKRRWCEKDKTFFYENQPVGTAVVAKKGSTVLLIRRNIQPGKGKWAFPGGFAEQGETIEAAARRELYEETGISAKQAKVDAVYTEISSAYGNVIVPIVVVKGLSGELRPGNDELEAVYFEIKKAPKLAFCSHNKYLKKLKAQTV
jgi:ADP-ribose pyrophosphatase YjhB (NUDIX family)